MLPNSSQSIPDWKGQYEKGKSKSQSYSQTDFFLNHQIKLNIIWKRQYFMAKGGLSQECNVILTLDNMTVERGIGKTPIKLPLLCLE